MTNSHPTTTLSRATEREAGKEPAKAWRNKYRVIKRHDDMSSGVVGPGDVLWGRYVYPSRELAEQAVAEGLRTGLMGGSPFSLALGRTEYLGPIPVPSC